MRVGGGDGGRRRTSGDQEEESTFTTPGHPGSSGLLVTFRFRNMAGLKITVYALSRGVMMTQVRYKQAFLFWESLDRM